MEIGETVYNGVKSLGGDEWTPIYKSYSIIYAMDGTKSNPSQVTVSSDDGQTVYNLNFSSMANNWSDGLVLSAQRKSANGQTTFRTTASTWTQDDPLKTFILNPRVISQTNTLDSGQSTQVQTTYSSDGTGNVSSVVEYGFDGLARRKTVTTYWHETHSQYVAKNLTNLVASVSIRNGSDTEVSRTTFAYDDYANYPMTGYSSVPNHHSSYDATYQVRGNRTGSSRYYIEQARSITAFAKYDIAGNVVWTQDPKGNVSTTSYASPYAFPSSTANALNQTAQMTWFATGSLHTATDANGASSTYLYDWLNRKTSEQTPAASNTFAYDDINYVFTSDTSSGYGYTTSDPMGDAAQTEKDVPTGNDIMQTTAYDAVGRVTSQTVPYQSGSGGASGTYQYDELGRIKTYSPPSGGQITYTYSGNSTIVSDPEQKRKESFYNEDGKLIKVVEEDANGKLYPNDPNYYTSYAYDTLGHLLQITQGAQTRSFT